MIYGRWEARRAKRGAQRERGQRTAHPGHEGSVAVRYWWSGDLVAPGTCLAVARFDELLEAFKIPIDYALDLPDWVARIAGKRSDRRPLRPTRRTGQKRRKCSFGAFCLTDYSCFLFFHAFFTKFGPAFTFVARNLPRISMWVRGRNGEMVNHSASRPRVLVIEDDDAIVKVLRLSLGSCGFHTERAECGGEALEAMDNDAFDAVLLDLCLPDGRAGDVLRRLQGAGCPPVWVVMSALDEEEARRRYGPLQGPFLPKPFDPLELAGLLDRLLEDREHTGRHAESAKS